MHQKGTFSKIKGNFSNIPIEAAFICNISNMSTVFNRSVVVKLKKNFKYMGHLYFEWSRQDIIYDVLAYLKIHNISNSNIDVRLVFKKYKAVKFICQYFLQKLNINVHGSWTKHPGKSLTITKIIMTPWKQLLKLA